MRTLSVKMSFCTFVNCRVKQIHLRICVNSARFSCSVCDLTATCSHFQCNQLICPPFNVNNPSRSKFAICKCGEMNQKFSCIYARKMQNLWGKQLECNDRQMRETYQCNIDDFQNGTPYLLISNCFRANKNSYHTQCL